MEEPLRRGLSCPWQCSGNCGIMESLWLEKPFKGIESNHHHNTPTRKWDMHLFYFTFINNSYKRLQKERSNRLWNLSSAPTKICTGTFPSTLNGQFPLSQVPPSPIQCGLGHFQGWDKTHGQKLKEKRGKENEEIKFSFKRASTEDPETWKLFKVIRSKWGS